jgi:hypothetical protein
MGANEFDPPPPATGGGTTTAPPTATPPPTGTPPPSVLPIADRLAPTISALSIGRRWRAGSTLATLSTTPRKRKRPPVGTAIRLRLSEAATLTLAFSQPSKRGRLVARGTLKLRAHAGTNTIRFAGRLSATKRLKAGAYRLTATATDAAGNRSLPRTARFTIVR